MRILALLLFLLLPMAAAPTQEPPAWHRQATALLEQGDVRQALALLDRTLARQPKLAAAHLLRGYALLKLDRPAAAAEAYRQALVPGSRGAAWAGLATARLRSNDPAGALDAAGKALGAGRTDAAVYRVGAVALGRLNRPRAALGWWRHLCRLEPGKVANWRDLGAALLATGKPDEAAAVAAESIRAFGFRADLVRLKAGACIDLGRDGEAADLLQTLHTLRLAKPREIAALGDLRLRLGDPAAAIRLYEQAGKKATGGVAGRRRLALAHWHAGNLKEAERLLGAIGKKATPDTLVELGDLRRALDRLPDALATYRAALAARPEHAGALLGVAQTLTALRRIEPARLAWRRLLAMDRQRLQARLGLARLLENQGQPRRALAQLRRARSEAPGDARVLDGILRLERALIEADNRNH